VKAVMKARLWTRIYYLATAGVPAKKICNYTGLDKGQVSHAIKALLDLGFLQCTSGQSQTKFYVATSKVFSGDTQLVENLNQQSKKRAKPYGGRYKRYHGITFKADIIKWGILPEKWDKISQANATRFYYLEENNATFIRCKGKWEDTLKMHIPDVILHEIEKDPRKNIQHEARLLMGKFQVHYNLRLKNFVKCPGESCGIVIRDPKLVKLVQEKTIKLDNGCEMDCSHNTPEFEGPPDIMDELLLSPKRLDTVESELIEIKESLSSITIMIKETNSTIRELSNIVNELKNELFSQPKRPDERIDVT